MNPILIAVIAVGAIGLVAGVILVLAGKFFAVPVDETQEKLRAALPGANCGGCGYSGCDGYASAVKDGAPCNLCAPGGDDVMKALSAIMGVEAVSAEKKTAVVRCRGMLDVSPKRYVYDGVKTCKAASLLSGGDSGCRFGCLGYGDCVSVCDQNAIRVIDGVARVDRSLCSGCGKCTRTCPRTLIELLPEGSATALCRNTDKGADTRKACKVGCIGCMKCEKICPEGAVKVTNFCAAVDYDKCTSCGLCVETCPLHVLFLKK